MKPTTLICDVDNTILNTRPRVKRCLHEIGRGEVYEKTLHSYGGFKDYLSVDEVDQFFKIFLSNKFLMEDAPLEGAAEVLHQWTQEHQLIYVTGRHDQDGDSMREGTLQWLETHGYPVPDEKSISLHMKPDRYHADEGYKRQVLTSFQSDYELVAGLGDLPYEGALYGELGLQPILVAVVGMFSDAELKATHPAVTVVQHWNEVPSVLAAACA